MNIDMQGVAEAAAAGKSSLTDTMTDTIAAIVGVTVFCLSYLIDARTRHKLYKTER